MKTFLVFKVLFVKFRINSAKLVILSVNDGKRLIMQKICLHPPLHFVQGSL